MKPGMLGLVMALAGIHAAGVHVPGVDAERQRELEEARTRALERDAHVVFVDAAQLGSHRKAQREAAEATVAAEVYRHTPTPVNESRQQRRHRERLERKGRQA